MSMRTAQAVREILGHRGHRLNHRFGGYYVLLGPEGRASRNAGYTLVCQAHGAEVGVTRIHDAFERLGSGDWCVGCVEGKPLRSSPSDAAVARWAELIRAEG